MSIYFLIKSLILWWGYWYLYNFVFLPKKKKEKQGSKVLSSYYMLAAVVTLVLMGGYSNYVLLGLVLTGFILDSVFNNFYTGMLNNSIFQMMWVYLVVDTLNLTFYVIWIGFFLIHLPVFTVTHLTLRSKLTIFFASLAGGLIIATIFHYFSFPFNLALMIANHLGFYILLNKYEKVLRLEIVNF